MIVRNQQDLVRQLARLREAILSSDQDFVALELALSVNSKLEPNGISVLSWGRETISLTKHDDDLFNYLVSYVDDVARCVYQQEKLFHSDKDTMKRLATHMIVRENREFSIVARDDAHALEIFLKSEGERLIKIR